MTIQTALTCYRCGEPILEDPWFLYVKPAMAPFHITCWDSEVEDETDVRSQR